MGTKTDWSELRLLRPVDSQLTQGFGENPQLYARFGQPGHNGLDFGCPLGTPVRAAASGKVVRRRVDPQGYGRYLMLEHAGYHTLYAHLESWEVGLGESVQAGQVIARSGNSGFSTGPHLHFELRLSQPAGASYPSGAVDPTPFFLALESRGAAPASSDAATGAGEWRVSAAAGLRVRVKPGGRPVGSLNFGDLVQVKHEQGQWAGILLWVHRDYLEPLDPFTRQPSGEPTI